MDTKQEKSVIQLTKHESALLSSLKFLDDDPKPKTSLSEFWSPLKSILPSVDIILCEINFQTKSNEAVVILKIKSGDYVFMRVASNKDQKEIIEYRKDSNLMNLLFAIGWFKYFEIFVRAAYQNQ